MLNSNPDSLNPKIDRIHNLITSAAEQDYYRTLDYYFSVADFHNSYDQALGGHLTYGFKPYISIRQHSANGQLLLENIEPIFNKISLVPNHPELSREIYITAQIEDDDNMLFVHLIYFLNGVQQPRQQMLDDGYHQDGIAGDKFYGVGLPAIAEPSTVDYYLVATDAGGNLSTAAFGAPEIKYSFNLGVSVAKLFINEFMASNDNTITDNFGEYEDWVEIHNADDQAIWLGGKFLSDNFNIPDKWALPDTSLNPGEFFLIWADDDDEQGSTHTNFKLDRDGKEIAVFNSEATGFVMIDSIRFGYQGTDISFGRNPDGGCKLAIF